MNKNIYENSVGSIEQVKEKKNFSSPDDDQLNFLNQTRCENSSSVEGRVDEMDSIYLAPEFGRLNQGNEGRLLKTTHDSLELSIYDKENGYVEASFHYKNEEKMFEDEKRDGHEQNINFSTSAAYSSTPPCEGNQERADGEGGNNSDQDNSIYLDFVRDLAENQNRNWNLNSDGASTLPMGGKTSKNTKSINKTGVADADSALKENFATPQRRKKLGLGDKQSNVLKTRPISMPPCDPPEPPRSFNEISPVVAVRGHRPLPSPPKREPDPNESSSSEYLNISSIDQKSSVLRTPPPPVPLLLPSNFDNSDYQEPISSHQLPSSALNQKQTVPVLTDKKPSSKPAVSAQRQKKNSVSSPGTPKKSNLPSPVNSTNIIEKSNRVHPIARMLKAKQTRAQLLRLPLKLNFNSTCKDDRSNLTNPSPEFDMTADKVITQSFSNSNKTRNFFKSPSKSKKSLPSPELPSPSISKIGSKHPTKSFDVQDFNCSAEKTSSSVNSRKPPYKQQSLKNRAFGVRQITSQHASNTSHELATNAFSEKKTIDDNCDVKSMQSDSARQSQDKKSLENQTAPFKKVVDSRGYTLHKLQVERLENQLKQKDQREVTKNKSPSFSPSLSSKNIYNSSPKKAGSSPLKTSEQRSNSKSGVSKSSGIRPKPRPSAPPPPRPTPKAISTELKKPPARPPPPSKAKIAESKRKQISKREILPISEQTSAGDKTSTRSSPGYQSEGIVNSLNEKGSDDEVYYSAIKDVDPKNRCSTPGSFGFFTHNSEGRIGERSSHVIENKYVCRDEEEAIYIGIDDD